MKYAYYNHTNVFKPGYNVQMGIMDAYYESIINTDVNDMNSFQSTVDSTKKCMENIQVMKKKKITEKNKYRAIHFKKDENYISTCPTGHPFTIEKVQIRMNEYHKAETVIKARMNTVKIVH